MENLYCSIYIVDVSQNPEEVDTVTSRIVQLIEDHGGVIKKNNPWGKRRLAYPIENKTSGFYVEIEFTAQSRLNIPQIIENEFRLNDRVMRYLTYVVSKEELRQREFSAKRAASHSEGPRNEKSDDAPRPKRSDKPASAVAEAEAKAEPEAEAKAEAEAKTEPEAEATVKAAGADEAPEPVENENKETK